MDSPSCCATQPVTPTTIGRFRFRCEKLRSRVKTASSAFSRTLQVLRMTTSASRSVEAARRPSFLRLPEIFSLSWAFIWQPQVSIQ
jgi:hypothetical protein